MMRRKKGKSKGGVFPYTTARGQRWGVDYRNRSGKRQRQAGFTTEGLAQEFALRMERQRLGLEPVEEATTPRTVPTVAEYAATWIEQLARLETARAIKPATVRSYRGNLDGHILPKLGAIPLDGLGKREIKDFLAEQCAEGRLPRSGRGRRRGAVAEPGDKTLSSSTVRIMLATLSAMLASAVEDGILAANPCAGVGKSLRLTASRRRDEIKALDRAQRDRFLAAAAEVEPAAYPLLYTLALTGMRIGEAFGLKWSDIDLTRRQIRVVRQASAGREGTPKSGQARAVDVSAGLAGLLRSLEIRTKERALATGAPASEYVFTIRDQSAVSKAFKRVLKAAALPLHYSPHCLRHTFASLLLQQGESPAYVQKQLGHASIQLTVDTYGKWLPMGNLGAVDRLERKSDEGESRGPSESQANEKPGVSA